MFCIRCCYFRVDKFKKHAHASHNSYKAALYNGVISTESPLSFWVDCICRTYTVFLHRDPLLVGPGILPFFARSFFLLIVAGAFTLLCKLMAPRPIRFHSTQNRLATIKSNRQALLRFYVSSWRRGLFASIARKIASPPSKAISGRLQILGKKCAMALSTKAIEQKCPAGYIF